MVMKTSRKEMCKMYGNLVRRMLFSDLQTKLITKPVFFVVSVGGVSFTSVPSTTGSTYYGM